MNLAILAAALVLGADGGKECVDIPANADMRMQQCGKYVFALADILPLTTRSTEDHVFAGLVMSANSAAVEPKRIDVTVGSTKYDGRVGVLSSGSFAGSELLLISMPLPGKERIRVLSCIAQLNLGAKREECLKRFSVMRDEAPLPERENVAPSLGGVPVAVPNGCRVVEGGIKCNDGLFLLPALELGDRKADDVDRAVASVVTQLASLAESASPVSAIDCVVQGKPARCQLVSSVDKVKQRYVHVGAPVADGDKKRIAVCLTLGDSRTRLAEVCKSVFTLSAATETPAVAAPQKAEPGCQTVPTSGGSRGQSCPPYVFLYLDGNEGKFRSLRGYFLGIVAGSHSSPVEPKEVQVTIGEDTYTALTGVLPSGNMAGWELLQVTTALPTPSRKRALTCIAQLEAGATREGCLAKFRQLRDEPPLPEEKAMPISLGGKPVAIPQGCREEGMALICTDGVLALPDLELTKLSVDERERLVASMVKEAMQDRQVLELNTRIDCIVQSKASRCFLSRSKKAEHEYFTLAAIIADGEKSRMSTCQSANDPRKTMPAVCSTIFSFKGSK